MRGFPSAEVMALPGEGCFHQQRGHQESHQEFGEKD